jgi:hypothetical protein
MCPVAWDRDEEETCPHEQEVKGSQLIAWNGIFPEKLIDIDKKFLVFMQTDILWVNHRSYFEPYESNQYLPIVP